MCQRSQLGRIGLAIDQRLNDRSTDAAHYVGEDRFNLDVGFL